MMRNPQSENRVVNAIRPGSHAAATLNGTGFSKHGFTTALVILATQTLGTAATVDVKVQESDVLGSGYADITGAAFAQKVKASHDNHIDVAEIDLRGRKKYLRVVAVTGAAASEFGVMVVLGNPERTEAVNRAQEGSAAEQAPIVSGSGVTGGYAFSV